MIPSASLVFVFHEGRTSGDTFTVFLNDGRVYQLDWRAMRSSLAEPPAWEPLPPVPGLVAAAEATPASSPAPTSAAPPAKTSTRTRSSSYARERRTPPNWPRGGER